MGLKRKAKRALWCGMVPPEQVTGDLGQVLEGPGEFLWTWMEPALEMGSRTWPRPLAASASWNA